MMKRLSLLLAALFVAATLFAAPVIASGNGDNNNSDKVCVLRHEDDNDKDYHWVWDVEGLHLGDKVDNDHFCEDDHNGNGNGDHNGNGGDDYHNGNEG
jgi:hypothetical protein